MSGLYWHFVDIVWIFLFPLLYLVERHRNVAITFRRSALYHHDLRRADGAHGRDGGRGLRRPGPFNFAVAMVIAGFKASLVVWYFMHVKYQSHLTKLTVATGIVLPRHPARDVDDRLRVAGRFRWADCRCRSIPTPVIE